MASIKGGATRTLAVVACCTLAAFAADTRKDFKYNVTPGASVSITNYDGPVTIRQAPGKQVLITAVSHSDKVEVDETGTGNRIGLRTHILQRAEGNDGSVSYDVQVPPGMSLVIHSGSGPITAEGVQGDMSLEGDASQVTVSGGGNGHVHVRTIGGPVKLTNISNGHVEITSVSGDVTLNSVSGSFLSVNTTKGKIIFDGDVTPGASYTLSTHSGDIDMTLPASASVDITARSVSGKVQNDFPFQAKAHPSFTVAQGRSFAGTSNAGSSGVQLRSFSGNIRVKKQ